MPSSRSLLASSGLFLIVVAVVWLKIQAESSFYFTPDSQIYTDAARHLVSGKGYTITRWGKEMFNSYFPVGYSALIALTAWLTHFPATQAAKVVNLASTGLLFFLFIKMYAQTYIWVISVCLSSTFLFVATCTWSETVFVVATVGYVQALHRFLNQPVSAGSILALFLWGTGMFLLRYIGLFSVAVGLMLAGLGGLRPMLPSITLTSAHRIGLFSASTCILAFAWGYLTYETRHENPEVTAVQPPLIFHTNGLVHRLKEVAISSAQELLFFIRDWDIRRTTPFSILFWLIVGMSVLQFLLLVRIIRELWLIRLPPFSPLNQLLLITGVSYYLIIVFLYAVHFDFMQSGIYRLYYRYYLPSSFLTLTALLGWIAQPNNQPLRNAVRWPVIGLFLLSILHSLPKSGWLTH